MIDRYTTPVMEENFGTLRKLSRWTHIERIVLQAQERAGIVPKGTNRAIADWLGEAYGDWRLDWEGGWRETLAVHEDVTRHDVGAFLQVLEERCGPEGKWLHYGLTSSDLVDTANGLALKDARSVIERVLQSLQRRCLDLAIEYADVPSNGRTHGQVAIPMFQSDRFVRWQSRLGHSIHMLQTLGADCAVGKISGPVGVFNEFIPARIQADVLAELGLYPSCAPSQVANRTHYTDWMYCMVNVASAIEQIALDVRLLGQSGVGELSEGFGAGQMGSSSMPHKHNTVTSEKLCGLARLVRSNFSAIAESEALWLERDISHSSVERVALVDATTLVHYMATQTATLLANLQVDITTTSDPDQSYRPLLERIPDVGTRAEAYEETRPS